MAENLKQTRIEAIDFLRGVAVLGILAINVTGFWGPSLATFSPAIPRMEPGGAVWFGFAFVVFEGKMRALFSMLFGASMVLFARAAQRRGLDPGKAQVRRLVWLAVFGYAHYALLWWGDILFPYALCGLCALLLMRLSPAGLIAVALPIYLLSHGIDALLALPGMATEQAVLSGIAAPADVAEQAGMMARIAASISSDLAVLDAGFVDAVRLRLANGAAEPLRVTLATFTETLPLMLIGMALLRSGFFTTWPKRSLGWIAAIGILGGAAASVAALSWLAAHGWPPRAMFGAIESGMAFPHLAMAIGYAAGLLLLFPHLRGRAVGRALVAAGRCAFSNYIGTTVLMGAILSGWGLGLGPELPRAWLPALVLLGWFAMLAWPRWWLARFGQGPLEALWRKLALPAHA